MEFAAPLVAKLREQAARFRELTDYLSSPEASADPRRMPTLLRQRGSLEATAALSDELDLLLSRRADAQKLLVDSDPEMRAMAREELELLESLEQRFDARVKDALIAEPEDFKRKVIVEVRAGTGGDEASLFVGDLFKLYQRYIENKGWRLEIFEATPSEVGGFKEVIFGVEGERVWSKLRFESGGHRVQRVPQTEAQGRIHTSAATVAVLPEAEEVELEIRDQDLRIDTMRAGGAGGQHVNKTESAVRITHIPTNTVVVCMDEKSQHKNRARAMRVLRTRLLDAERQRLHDERSLMRKTQVGTGDRNARVRTYNWPQNRMTDHRLNENFSLEQVLAGKLDAPIEKLEARDREDRIGRL
ncbi:MAG: peptide chain release factor 1 [Planctomycetota bacterium]